jgi:hypothetical protein
MLSILGDSPHVPAPLPRGLTGRYFLLSLAVAWPTLWFWFSELGRAQSWTRSVLFAVPLLLTASVAAVWAIFLLAIWRRDSGPPGAGESNLGVIAAGTAGIASWFALTLVALLVVPWWGIGHSGIGFPNPLGFLGAIVAGFAITFFCARKIGNALERGPTAGLIIGLLSAAAVSCLSVVIV